MADLATVLRRANAEPSLSRLPVAAVATPWRDNRPVTTEDTSQVMRYNQTWPHLFADLGGRIRVALRDVVTRIDHIGSIARLTNSATPRFLQRSAIVTGIAAAAVFANRYGDLQDFARNLNGHVATWTPNAG
jgi:hypothetical protein